MFEIYISGQHFWNILISFAQIPSLFSSGIPPAQPCVIAYSRMTAKAKVRGDMHSSMFHPSSTASKKDKGSLMFFLDFLPSLGIHSVIWFNQTYHGTQFGWMQVSAVNYSMILRSNQTQVSRSNNNRTNLRQGERLNLYPVRTHQWPLVSNGTWLRKTSVYL